MLEIQVSLRRAEGTGEIGATATAYQKVGDVLVMKRSPAKWSQKERRYWLIAYYDDPALEAEMGDRTTLVRPFERSMMLLLTNGSLARTVFERSTFRVDIGMFEDTAGLDPNEANDPVVPNGQESLVFPGLVLEQPPANDKRAALLESGGKKAALAAQKVASTFDVMERITFTLGGVMWRHGCAPPEGATQIPFDDVCPSIRAFPSAADLTRKGVPRVREVGAKYVVHGTTYPLVGTLRRCLRNNVVLVSPLMGYTEQQAETEAAAAGIEWNDTVIDVEGEQVEHGQVITE